MLARFAESISSTEPGLVWSAETHASDFYSFSALLTFARAADPTLELVVATLEAIPDGAGREEWTLDIEARGAGIIGAIPAQTISTEADVRMALGGIGEFLDHSRQSVIDALRE